jgi:signal peptidase II
MKGVDMLKSLGVFIFSSPGQVEGSVSLKKWLSLAALIIVLDQISKLWISSHFSYGEQFRVTDFFNVTLVHNAGAAFAFLHDAGGWQRWMFSVISIVAAVWIVRLLRQHAQQTFFCFALALILGGAVGNLIDRVAYGYVVDFLDFHWAGYHFATFNVADAAISVGAVLLLLDSFRKK